MPTTDPIVITPSTSVVLVNTADFTGNPIVLLPNIDSLGRIITIRDADGGSLAKPIYISTTGGALFQQEISTVTISSLVITQPYGFYTITPRLTDIGGTTRYGIMNAFAFRESSDYAYVNMFNTNMAYMSTVSTVNLGVTQDLGVSGNVNIAGSVNVGGSINYINPGTVSFTANDINATNISTNTIKSATTYASTLYASSIYLANTLEASTLRLTSRPVFDLSGSGSWSNYMSGGTDPNSMTLGSPDTYAGAQIATDSNFFGIRSFNASSSNFSTSVITRDGNVGINLPFTNITYNVGGPNYNLAVKGALRLSNYDTRTQQADILFRGDGRAGASNRYVNAFAGTNSQYTLYSANNYSQGFYTSGNEYQWVTADKGATYPETIKFWTGNNEERMRIDSVGNVGIGKTSPAQALDVSGAVSATAMSTIAVSTATITASMGSVSLPSYSFGGDANTGFYSPAPDTVAFATGGGERMVINSAGQVGITTTTGVALDVSGQIRTATSIVLADGSLGTPALNFTADTNTGLYRPLADTIGVVTGGSEAVRIDGSGIQFRDGSVTKPSINFGLGGTTDPDTGIYHPANNIIGLVTAATERMRIDSNGNVGIGTDPGALYRLDICGGAVRINNSAGIPIELGSDFGNSNANLELGKGRTSNGGAYIDLTAVAGGDFNTRLLRETGLNGNFAISNTGTGQFSITQSGAGGIVLNTNATERMRIDSSGNVGIGAAAEDTYKLDVTGKSRAKNEFWVGSNTTNGFIRMTVDSGTSYIQSSSNTSGTHNKLYFTGYVGARNTMALDISNQRVGIGGQIAPTVALDVTGQIKTSASLLVPNGSAAAPAMTFTDDADTGIYRSNTNELSLTTGGTQRVIVNSSGNVGIGKTPTVALDVAGQIKTDNSILLANGSAAAPAMTFTSDTDTGIFQTGAGIFSIATDGVQRSYITSNEQRMYFGEAGGAYTSFGNTNITIGQGRTTPANAFIDLIGDVSWNDYGLRIIRSSGGPDTTSILAHSGSGDFIMTAQQAGTLRFRTQDITRMTIDSAGNVGIGGGTDSSYKLKVTGDLNVTGSITGSISSVPAGCIMMFGGGSAPTGWLLCDGTSYTKSTYPDLSNAIGNTYGGSSTNFNVPDLRDRVPVGKGTDVSSNTLGYTAGSKTHTLTIAEMPSHNHDLINPGNVLNTIPDDKGSGGDAVLDTDDGGADWIGQPYTISYRGGGEAHNNMQPYIVVNYIIKT